MRKRTIPHISLILIFSLLLCACNNKKEINIKPDADNTQVLPSKEAESDTESEMEKETQSQTQKEETAVPYERKYIFNQQGKLQDVYIKDELEASYQYSGDFVSYKLSEGKYTAFSYKDKDNAWRRIDSIDYNGEYKITYIYDKLTVNSAAGYVYDLVGFEYNGVRYKFIDDYGTIIGISDSEGNQVVKYEYLKYGKSPSDWVPYVKSFDGENWDVNNEPDFIGNINRVFGDMLYYDASIGLWMGPGSWTNPVSQNAIKGTRYENGYLERIEVMYE